MNCFLSDLKLNTERIINSIDTDKATKDRLESLGIIPGMKITPVMETPLKPPVVYQCLNTLVALKEDVSGKVSIGLGG